MGKLFLQGTNNCSTYSPGARLAKHGTMQTELLLYGVSKRCLHHVHWDAILGIPVGL